MKKILLSAAALLALTLGACSGNKTGNNADSDSAIAKQQAEAAAVKADEAKENYEITDGGLLSTNSLPMLVDFSAEWCPPCRQLKPIFAELKEEYKGKIDFVTINVDSMPELSKRYNIQNIPAIVFIAPDGQEVNRVIGFHDKDEMKAEITKTFK